MKKRIISILIALVMAVGMISAAATTAFAADESTWDYNHDYSLYQYVDFSPFTDDDDNVGDSVDNPYQISTPAQLAGLAVLVNECSNPNRTLGGIGGNYAKPQDFSGKYIKLTANIDLSAHEWVPIGIENYAFKGNFDGAGYSISGLKIGSESAPNEKYSSAGLFGYVENATIKNLGVSGEIYTDASEDSSSNAGGFVGCVNTGSGATTITNCYNLCTVSCRTAGGFVGRAVGTLTMENCYNAGIVSSTTNAGGLIGGIAADANTELDCCYYNSGKAIGNNRVYTGSTQKLSQAQMQGLAGVTESSWERIEIINANGSLVDALNKYVYNNSTETLSTWHIHDGEYPTLGDVKYENGVCVCGYACDHSDNTNAVTDNGDGTHSFKCAKCGADVTEAHTGTAATCVTSAYCEKCKNYYGTENKSNHDTSLKYDRDGNRVTEIEEGVTYYGENGYNQYGFCAGGCYQPAELVDNVYQISNAGQLFWFAEYVNAGNTAINGKLMNDITVFSGLVSVSDNGKYQQGLDPNDTSETYAIGTGIDGTTAGAFYVMTSDGYVEVRDDVYHLNKVNKLIAKIRPWTPIGNVTYGFSGTFDGNSKTISGLYINDSSATSIGLFGYVTGGTVKDLTLSNSFFNGYQDVGGVVGSINNGTTKNCTSYATVCGAMTIGGIAGYCSSIDSVYNISDCYNMGTVSGVAYVGGIAGSIERCSIKNSLNTEYGKVISTGMDSSRSYVGGIVGHCIDGFVSGCLNNGNVSGKGYVGGVVGYSESSTVEHCYSNNSTVSGTSNVGGIVGFGSSIQIYRCYNESDVSSTSYYVGGVIGYNDCGSVADCYNTGNISGEYTVGGIVGSNSGTVSNCYYLADSEADSIDGTTAMTSAQFASGEVAYLLNGDQTNIVWYQTCGEGLPAFSGSTVYKYTDCNGVTALYTNDLALNGTVVSHTFTANSNGFCVKGCYEPATLNNNGTANDTTDDYYEISNAGQLYWFAQQVNGGNTSINGKLTKDIVVNAGTMTESSTGVRVWTPIGNSSNNYSGTFDGGNFTVSGLYFNDSEAIYVGLFGYVTGGTVKYLTLSNSFFNGYQDVGGVVGSLNNGTIKNCTSYATVCGAMSIGGIAGYCSSGTIIDSVYNIFDCYNMGTVSGAAGVGGIIGVCENSSVYGCANNGNVIGTSMNVGGIVGLCENSLVSGCINNVNVSGEGFVGGVVGHNDGSTVKDCYSDNCTVSGRNSVGGIVGYINFNATVSRCNNASDVSGIYQVGGVVGYIQGGSVSDCYNTGNISGTKWVGGVVGDAYDSTCNVSNCYNTGKVSGETNIGGIVGFDSATVSNCYYLADSETDSIDGTTFKTAAQFASGEVTYLLNGDQATIVWYQTCGTGLPEFSGDTVYKATKGCTGAYVNDPNAEPEHTFTADSNGFCAACGSAYQPAELNGNVYEISSAGQLYWFAQQVNGGNTSINAELTADIVVNPGTFDINGNYTPKNGESARTWTPIGNSTNRYDGTFDGKNHTVSGLYFFNSITDNIGLFGWVNKNGIIQNVGVVNSYFSCFNYVGSVVGCNEGKVQNCYNTGTVNGNNFVGGVVGYSNVATVNNCYNTGMVSGGESASVGGVVGCVNRGTVQNCYNTGTVSGGESAFVGGVVGNNGHGTIQNCYYNNTVYSGSAIGDNDNVTVTNVEGKTSAQFTSGEVAYLLNGDQSGIVWYQTCGEGLPAYSGIRVYRNQLGGCSEVSYKYEYSNEQKAPVTTHDTTKFTYAKASIVNSITATCGDCRTANWTVTLTAPENAVYNGSFIPATVTGEIPGVKVTVSYNKDPINAGAYTASVTLGDVKASVEYNIAQKVLIPTITGRVTKVYDGTNAVPAGLSIVLEGIVGADNVTASAIYTFDRPDAGTKKVNAECILLSGEKLGNYTLSSSTASADVGEITKAQSHLITAPTAIGGLIYNKQAQPLVTPGAAEFGTIVYSFDCMNWSTSIATAVNAGSYTVFYKVAGDQNHLDTAPAVITVSVAQREVGIIWGQTAFEFNEQRQVPTATVIGVLPGDVCTVGVQGWGVYGGTYTATARSLSNPNYKLPASGTTCQFTITVDYDKEADKVLDGIGNAIGNAVQEHVVPAITNAFNEMLENLFKMFANLFD